MSHNKKILVVDDEIELCDLIAFQLEDEGYKVRQAYSFHEAVETYSDFKPDIVLSDMQMPGGTGLDLFNQLKEKIINESCRFYIVSGFVSMDEEEIVSLGIQGVIKKPMSFTDLLSSIGKAS